jgi:hypothetical protein
MSKPRQSQREQSAPPIEPHQMSISFESNRLHGLPADERMKVLRDLACLLMLAAGVAVEEGDDEC